MFNCGEDRNLSKKQGCGSGWSLPGFYGQPESGLGSDLKEFALIFFFVQIIVNIIKISILTSITCQEILDEKFRVDRRISSKIRSLNLARDLDSALDHDPDPDLVDEHQDPATFAPMQKARHYQ